MSISLWIPPNWQFGALSPGEARESATQQAVAQTIRRHLFEQETDSDRILRAFAVTLSQGFVAPRARPAAQGLWNALFPTPPPSTSAGDEQPVPESIQGAFCLTVQALCSAIAHQWVGGTEPVGDDEDVEENPDKNDDEVEETPDPGEPEGDASSNAGDWRADYQRVVRALVALLRQTAWRWLRAQSDSENTAGGAEEIRLIATLLLDALLGVLGDWFAVETFDVDADEEGARRHKYIVLRKPELTQRIKRLLDELPFRFTLHPLKEPAAYRLNDPGPADTDETDYFRVDLIGYRRTNTFLRRFHARATHSDHCAVGFQRYLDAVNLQQAVPWRINRELLHWARCLVAIGGGKAKDSVDTQSEIAALDAGALSELRNWIGKHFYRPSKTDTRRTIVRPGEFLDSPLADLVIKDLCRDGAKGEPLAFYLPWKADYRGRIYAETPWLTPQGGDLQRALFEFHSGCPLDDKGVCALRRHGANLADRRWLLADLGIEGRQVVTLEERERWVQEHEAEILASAASPLTEPFWRKVAGKPMQFLAFCLAYRQWKRDPSAPVHLPVQIDGTCNGLQHIAAIMGDANLAQAVNVLPRSDHLPGDIYSELAEASVSRIGTLKIGAKDSPGLKLADEWLAASPARKAWLNRDAAKKVVMTIPYGASYGAQARHVLEAIAAAFDRDWREEPALLVELDGLVAWKEQDEKHRIFVRRCTRRLLGKPPKAAFAGGDEETRQRALQKWERRRILAAYVALALVRHLRDTLAKTYPSVNDFSGWLKKKANACAGLPLLWPSPLGFPVCQDKFSLKGTSVTGHIGNKVVRIDIQRLDEKVAPDRQRNAVLPNLIHSLDATHLAMTLLEAKNRNVTEIGSIHDCLLCHPNDASVLGQCVRDTFVRLYRTQADGIPEVLADWNNWMNGIARLRSLSNVNLVLGALDHPDGMGERILAAQQIFAVEELRRLSPSRQFLMRSVLEFMRDYGWKGAGTAGETAAEPPIRGNMAFSKDSGLSEYFFS